MKITKEMIKMIQLKVEELNLEWDYEYIGIRVQEEPFELGAIEHLSHNWVDGEDTGEELDGICAVKVDMIAYIVGEYYGNHLAIVAGNAASCGEDVGEIIIEDAEVVAIMI